MFKKTNVWRGMSFVCALLFTISVMAANILEIYRTSVDAFVGTRSQKTVTDETENTEDAWTYQSKFKTAEEAYEGFKELAVRTSQETYVLLKNENNALPLSNTAKLTLFGVRSYAPVYGNNGGSVPDGKSTVQIFDAFTERGFELNPSMLDTYAAFFADKEWTTPQFGGGILPAYEALSAYDDPNELTLEELRGLNADFDKDYASYNDAAVVVVGRVGGENGNGYYPGEAGRADGVETVTGNILSLSDEEMAIIEEAKANFDKVIVLVNATNPMEIANLKEDPDIDAILWIGYPGAYGFYGVADVLNGTISPSGHLGDVFAKNSALAPAMSNYGDIAWANAADFSELANVNSYLVEAEGIYTGYRYYETRYADIVLGNGGSEASAGTYANADGTIAQADGTWEYANEIVYPFGYGLSYTDFEQTLDSVEILGSKETATVRVTTTNTGSVPGSTVVQLYAQTPYTDYDKQYHVEKAAVQLMDFEKTNLLNPGESQTIVMEVDMANLASYDSENAKTYEGLTANEELSRLLENDIIELKTGEDTSDIVFGDKTSELTINDLKDADFDDPRWEELTSKVTIDEFLNFAANAFHNIAAIDSVGLPQYAADDGPNGSDSHYLTEGGYQGVPYEDAAEYDYGTRVGPTPQNIAYSWNKELAYENGEVTLGESTLVLNLPIIIGPGMNIHRHAYNSRGAEYYSEDPVLTGYIGSAVVQGAQSKGTLVNIKHVAFNDQEINRSGIAVFMNEQKARELELRGLQQAFEANGKPAAFQEYP